MWRLRKSRSRAIEVAIVSWEFSDDAYAITYKMEWMPCAIYIINSQVNPYRPRTSPRDKLMIVPITAIQRN